MPTGLHYDHEIVMLGSTRNDEGPANAIKDGWYRAVLLTPLSVPEPSGHALAITALGIMCLAMRLTRHAVGKDGTVPGA